MRLHLSAGLMVASLTLVQCHPLKAQATAPSPPKEATNPFAGNPAAVRQGAILFRQECVFCHGLGARGGMRGPDLTVGAWTHGGTDAAIAHTIVTGVPGTAMPPNPLTEDEVWQLVTYLQSVQQPSSAPIGDAVAGERLFFGKTGNCAACHMVKGRGGRLGPDLSRIGASRPRAYLIESIRDPDRQLADNPNFTGAALSYDTVVAVTQRGETIRGVPLNEDTFTVQLMDRSETIFSFDKKSLKSLRHERASMMPAYSADELNEHDLRDVVAYLQSLRGPASAVLKGGTK